VFSQSVLLALVEAGLARDDAYRLVQELAVRTGEGTTDFRSVVSADPRVRSAISDERIAEAFEVNRIVRFASRAVDALTDGGA
jgi:adenylosuccinate lyase